MDYQILGKTNLRVSKLGFGCAPLGNQYGDIDDSEGIRAVHAAALARRAARVRGPRRSRPIVRG